MVSSMTEWALQERLVEQWGIRPFRLGGHSVRLLSWEVMTPSWQINDSRGLWTEPSVDFLGVTQDGSLMAIELKRVWGGPVTLAQAAAQALASALRVEQSVANPKLESVYRAARQGAIGRVPLVGPETAADAVAQHTGGLALADVLGAAVISVVAIEQARPTSAREQMTMEEVFEVLGRSVQRDSVKLRSRLHNALDVDSRERRLSVDFVPFSQ